MTLHGGVRPLVNVLPKQVRHSIKQVLKPIGSATARWRMLPGFLIIGARKGGTTSLYAYLTEHPQVLPALEKEIFFFIGNYDKGPAWYRGHFPTLLHCSLAERAAGGRVITGEATANYLHHLEVPERVGRLLPDVKLVVVLRDPVDRAISDYFHGVRHGRYTPASRPLEPLVERELEQLEGRGGDAGADQRGGRVVGIVERGLYLNHVMAWLRVFPREQMLILLSDDLYRDPGAEYAKLTAFLDLRPHALRRYDALNANRYPAVDAGLVARLAEFYAPHNERLAQFLGLSLEWGKLERSPKGPAS
jgi:hypothetical protein